MTQSSDALAFKNLLPTSPPCPVVGIGASAGGLESLSQLLGAFPSTSGMALVVVSHLAPDHPSLLAELLARASSLPVAVVLDGTTVEPDHVYVMPPNTTLRLEGQQLHLSPRAEAAHPHQPIDSFFQSLAEANGSAAIGVVLSGTGADGTLGLCAIKAVNGTTLAQLPETASYKELPQSAIKAGCVDIVLPPEALAGTIASLATHANRASLDDQTTLGQLEVAGDLKPLFTLVQAATDIDFSAYKPSTLLRRLQRRMALHQCATVEAYLQYMHSHPDEIWALARDFLIGVTEFFRDPEAFVALQEKVLKPLLQQRSKDSPVRVWVIGCATGQEAYSLAMLLTETAEAVGCMSPIQIFATDINDIALSIARTGIYTESSVQNLTPAQRERFLVPVDQGYRIVTSLRERCVFALHNLLNDPPFSSLDLICCRNMLIYLERSQQQQVIPVLHYALNPGGVLMLGASEQLLSFDDLFAQLDNAQRLYVRTGSTRVLAFPFLSRIQSHVTEIQSRVMTVAPEEDRAMQQIAHRIMATHYAQPGVLITASYDILHIYGHTGRYLEPAPGETSMNLLRMARNGLLAPIQRAVEQANQERILVRVERIQLLVPGETHRLTLEVTPIRDSRTDDMLFLVVFMETTPLEHTLDVTHSAEQDPSMLADAWHEEMQALRAELAASKAYMRTIIAEQTTTNDELTLLNEELLSRNEEVQSINEELQTAKEEIQSINEELLTVNEELQQRNSDVNAINNDLYRLLASINIPIVMIDHSGSISRFTPPAAQLLGLRPDDIGRTLRTSVGNISMSLVEFDTLIADVQQRGQPAELSIDISEEQSYLLRIWPAHNIKGVIDGVALVWIDVAALKQAEDKKRRLERSLSDAQKLESLGILAGGVAHDFNNLLAIILGNAQLALLSLDAETSTYEIVNEIEATCRRAIELTRQMLAYAGRGQRELEVVDLNMLVKSTDNLLQASLNKQVTLRYSLNDAALWVRVDTTQIRQVLMNLVLNSAEAIGSSPLVVTIRTLERSLDSATLATFEVGAHTDPGTYVILEVTDTGIGMDSQIIDKIFEPFYSTKFTGRGLGLAAISGIVQTHGGAIHVQSKPGQGTTMTVALPRAPHELIPSTAAVKEAPAPQTTIQHSSAGGKVLVIDDEDGVRNMANRLLNYLGFTSVMAADGAAGIEQFKQIGETITLVLLDVTMPGLNTGQIVEALRAIRADIPILMMSGYPKDSIKDLFETAGFLPKPFMLEELRDAIQTARKKSNVA